jgi:hypothetical protein
MENVKAGYLVSSTGVKSNAVSGTGRYLVNLPHLPSVTLLFITFSGTGSLNIELKDGKSTDWIPIRTIAANSLVKIALPASGLAVNITANSGTATIHYRTVEVNQIPNVALEVFTAGDIVPQEFAGSLSLSGTYKKLYQGQPASTGTTLYTVPAATQTHIKYIVVTNTTGTDRTFTLYHDGTGAANNIVPASTVVAGGFAEYNGDILMETGDTLYCVTSVSTTLTVTVYGIEQAL